MICEACGGSGQMPIGEHHVTLDMAIDAGDREMAGMSMGVEWGPCSECGGAGEIRDGESCHDCGEPAVQVFEDTDDASGYKGEIALCADCLKKRESAA